MTQKDRNTDPVGRGRIYNSITETIGNTPIVSLSRMAAEHAVEANLLAKLEFFNPIASVKDRIGVAMIDLSRHHVRAVQEAWLDGYQIIEACLLQGEFGSVEAHDLLDSMSVVRLLVRCPERRQGDDVVISTCHPAKMPGTPLGENLGRFLRIERGSR